MKRVIDGQSAMVVFYGLAQYFHGNDGGYMVARKRNRWRVEWRHLNYHK